MDKIKLVIWDLDETFWKGTLSEEGISPLKENIEILEELTKRGIVNSIVSKNDFNEAKLKLKELEVWQYFIFPKIEWSPKGVAVKSVIESCQLRAPNVLFVDDNHSNLEEAKFYNEGLHIATPDILSQILDHPAFEGKNDEALTRLQQYKILESKRDAKSYFSSNYDFLKSSDIKLILEDDLLSHKGRIAELIERTNQLNYTKKRISASEVEVLLKDASNECGLIRVVDKFGDYGSVGFYCLRGGSKLEHFVFSCRILNLGVTQFIYSYLGFPELDVVPEVAEELDNSTPDWIELSNPAEIETKDTNSVDSKPKVLFKGGCDLSQMTFYLSSKSYEITEETSRVSAKGFPIQNEHSAVLLDSLNFEDTKKQEILNGQGMFFTDGKYYETDFFSNNYDCLIYSPLMDYTQDMYYSKELGVSLPFGGYYNDLADVSNHEEIMSRYKENGLNWITGDMLKGFSEKFINKGQLSGEAFLRNLKSMRAAVPLNVPIIFLNGAEIDFDHPLEVNSSERHREMNRVLDGFVNDHENVYLVDIRKIVLTRDQIDDNLRHYKREVYYLISLELLKLLGDVLNVEVKGNFMKLKKIINKIPYAERVMSKLRKR